MDEEKEEQPPQETYIPFSREPFAGDPLIGEEIARLCKEYGIRTILETGTQSGSTTRELAKLATTYTVESDFDWYYPVSQELSKIQSPFRVTPYYGYSHEYLKTQIPEPALVYLDAHTKDGSPIKEELELISTWRNPPIVVIHDVKVPDKDFGYDTYTDGTELTYQYFERSIGWPHMSYYNKEANGARRGVIYIIPTLLKQKEPNATTASSGKPHTYI